MTISVPASILEDHIFGRTNFVIVYDSPSIRTGVAHF